MAEDEAIRAVRAGVAMQDAFREFVRTLTPNPSPKLGEGNPTVAPLPSWERGAGGEGVVGQIGDDLRMEYTAQGYVVGPASRMEQICEPGCVYLTEHTARLVDGYFALRDLGETRVKSASRPIRVHELLGVGALRTRFDLSRARGLSKFVGRQTQMQTLEQVMADARAGRGQEALRDVRRAFEIAETLSSRLSRATARMYCAEVGSLLALWPDTERWGQEGVAIVREHQVAMMLETGLLTFWAEAVASRGESERAQELIAEAIAKAQSLANRVTEFRAHLGRARILLWTSASPNGGEIEAALRTAEHLAGEIGLAGWLPWVYEECTALALALGDHETQRAHLEEARRLSEQIGATGHLERLAKAMGRY